MSPVGQKLFEEFKMQFEFEQSSQTTEQVQPTIQRGEQGEHQEDRPEAAATADKSPAIGRADLDRRTQLQTERQ